MRKPYRLPDWTKNSSYQVPPASVASSWPRWPTPWTTRPWRRFMEADHRNNATRQWPTLTSSPSADSPTAVDSRTPCARFGRCSFPTASRFWPEHIYARGGTAAARRGQRTEVTRPPANVDKIMSVSRQGKVSRHASVNKMILVRQRWQIIMQVSTNVFESDSGDKQSCKCQQKYVGQLIRRWWQIMQVSANVFPSDGGDKSSCKCHQIKCLSQTMVTNPASVNKCISDRQRWQVSVQASTLYDVLYNSSGHHCSFYLLRYYLSLKAKPCTWIGWTGRKS